MLMLPSPATTFAPVGEGFCVIERASGRLSKAFAPNEADFAACVALLYIYNM